MVKSLLDRSKDSSKMLPYWEEVEIILQGEDEIRAAGEMFLPRLPGEDAKQYNFRLTCIKFTNIYSDILGTLSSKPFEEEISLVEGEGKKVPEQVSEFIENVDGEGNNLTVFAQTFFLNAINDAIAWIFIDYPESDTAIRTVADAKAAKIRPFWSHVLAKNVLEVKTTIIGGERQISYIRILEPDENENDHVRVFERDESGLVSWQLHSIDPMSKVETLKKEGVLTIDAIPFVPLITGKRDGKRFVFIPPLKSAETLQKTLYRQESALEFAKVMTAFPMLSASGVKPKTDSKGNPVSIYVGPQTVLYAPPDGNGVVGSWAYVEPSAQSLKFLAEDIDKTKQDLRELGKQPLTAQAGLTVITTAYAAGKSKSAVKSWGITLKDSLENALLMTCKWFNISQDQYDPEINVYDDYDDLSEEDFSSIMEMRKNGDISQETAWTEAKRRGILSAEFDDEVERARLLKELPGDGEEEFETTEKETKDDQENPNRKPFGR